MDQLCACACGFQLALDHQLTTHVANQTLHVANCRICTSHSNLYVIHLIFSLYILHTMRIEHCTQGNVGV